VYVNKQSPINVRDPIHNPNMLPDSFYRRSAQTYKGPDGETPVVDKVLLTSTDDNQFVIKTLVRASASTTREWTWWTHTGGGNALTFKQPT
jgi:DNA-directed RNA polymerase III subunit RPC2